jgi:transposase
MTHEQAEQILKELEVLRKLQIFSLFDKGYSQRDVAQLLGLSQPTISRMFPRLPTKKKVTQDG